MKISIFSFRYGVEIMSNKPYKIIYNEIINTCNLCPVPVFPDKSEKQAGKDVVQQILNQYIKLSLIQKGWKAESEASPNNINDALRFDFAKNIPLKNSESLKIRVEVEFGNAASYYRDLYKFQRAFTYKNADICVLILPTNKLGTRIDSGLANFEKAKRELPDSILSTTVPIIVIGLENDTNSELDLSKYMHNAKIAKDTNTPYVLLRDIFLKSYLKHRLDPSVPLLSINEDFEKAYLDLFKKISLHKKSEKELSQLQQKIASYEAESSLSQSKKSSILKKEDRYNKLKQKIITLLEEINKEKEKLGISDYI